MENKKVKLTIENIGEITLRLYPDKAPLTVENFVNLVQGGFYTGLIFHRIIPGFMIQGGGMTGEFEPKETASIKGEFAANGFPKNDIKHKRGVISMARTNDPDSASSQFFIMHEDSPHLDGQYAAFGEVVSGIEVVDKIANIPTASYGWYQDVPTEPVVIEKAELID